MLNDPAITQQLGLLLKVALAMVLGGVIGYDREQQARPAGLRTHMLMAGSATLIVSVSTTLVGYFSQRVDNSVLRADVSNVIQAVIIGVSFLGSGTIIRHPDQDRVKGLTTAATLLFVAIIGITVAAGQFILAVGATLLVLITVRSIRWLEQRKQP